MVVQGLDGWFIFLFCWNWIGINKTTETRRAQRNMERGNHRDTESTEKHGGGKKQLGADKNK